MPCCLLKSINALHVAILYIVYDKTFREKPLQILQLLVLYLRMLHIYAYMHAYTHTHTHTHTDAILAGLMYSILMHSWLVHSIRVFYCYRTEHLSVEDKQQHEVCTYMRIIAWPHNTCMYVSDVVVHVLVIMLYLQQMKKKFEAGDLTSKDLELVIHVNYIIVLGAHWI